MEEKELLFEQEQLAFALDSTYINKTSLVADARKYTKEQLQNFMQNPLKNRLQLQDVSKELFTTNSIYQKLILYYTNLMTFDYFLYPIGGNYKNLLKNMYVASEYLDKLSLKSNFTMIAEDWLKLGEVFYYELEDNSGLILKKIPNSICRVNRIENGVLRYEIDISKLTEKDILENGFPDEFLQLYNDFKAKKEKQSKLKVENNPSIDENWREVSDKGVAFSTTYELSNSIPVFTGLFEGILTYNQRAGKQEELLDAENLAIVHLKTPMDEKTGKMLMDFKLQKTFHDAAKRNLPKNIAISTNPLEMEVLQLKNQTSDSMADTNLKNASIRILNEAGVSGALFNSEKVTGEILKHSILTDTSIMKKLIYMLESWINYKLGSGKTKKFKISILDTDIFNKENALKNAKDNLAYGGSRLYFLACCGLTPQQALANLTFEIENDIDALFIPLQTSHTMSGKEEQKESGRPQGEATEGAERERARK